jgi:hypothetical protein
MLKATVLKARTGIVAAISLVFTLALADDWGPEQDFTEHSADSEYIFVMLGRSDSYLGSAPDPDIRALYSQAGLYRNDGSTEPLWTVDWYGSGILISDSVHFVRKGTMSFFDDQLALAFYRNGEELAWYSVFDLVGDRSRLSWTITTVSCRLIFELFEQEGKLAVETCDDQIRRFSIVTGEMLP